MIEAEKLYEELTDAASKYIERINSIIENRTKCCRDCVYAWWKVGMIMEREKNKGTKIRMEEKENG